MKMMFRKYLIGIAAGVFVGLNTLEGLCGEADGPKIIEVVREERPLEKKVNAPVTISAELDGNQYSMEIPLHEFLRYEMLPPVPRSVGEYLNYVTFDNPHTKKWLGVLTADCTSKKDRLMRIVEYIHSLRYISDGEFVNESKQRIAIERVMGHVLTMFRGAGDCEDLSITAASLTKACNIPTALVMFDGSSQGSGSHMGLGIDMRNICLPVGCGYRLGRNLYSYVECTRSGWGIGQIPSEYKEIVPKLLVVERDITTRMLFPEYFTGK